MNITEVTRLVEVELGPAHSMTIVMAMGEMYDKGWADGHDAGYDEGEADGFDRGRGAFG